MARNSHVREISGLLFGNATQNHHTSVPPAGSGPPVNRKTPIRPSVSGVVGRADEPKPFGITGPRESPSGRNLRIKSPGDAYRPCAPLAFAAGMRPAGRMRRSTTAVSGARRAPGRACRRPSAVTDVDVDVA